MSTCQGAAAPHKNCPHGDRCDWKTDYSDPAADFTITSTPCLLADHGRCGGCGCQCHKVRALRADS